MARIQPFDRPEQIARFNLRVEARPNDAIYACGGCARKLDGDDHARDVTAIRQALEAGADVSSATDWPAFWARRSRLWKAAEAIEEPVRATVEWMGQEREERHG